MNTLKKSLLLMAVVLFVAVISAYAKKQPKTKKENNKEIVVNNTINMFVTHGHCSTPFSGEVSNLKVDTPVGIDTGNPLENMNISFEIDPNSFKACRGDMDELTKRIKTPDVFISKSQENIIFKTTNVFVMGLDWYQINGILSIKGIEREVKFFATGMRNSYENKASVLVLQGQVDLFDWGIDYDKLVNGKSLETPTKWLYLNMKINLV